MATSTPQNPRKEDVASAAGRAAGDVKHQAQQAAHQAGTMASQAGQKISDAASQAGQKASELASGVAGRADSALSSVGQGMTSLADTIRQQAPREGYLGSAATAVADNLRSGGEYLQRDALDSIGTDLTDMIRRYPLPALLVGFGVGYFVACATSSRR